MCHECQYIYHHGFCKIIHQYMQPKQRNVLKTQGKAQLAAALNSSTQTHCCGVCFNEFGSEAAAARLECHPKCIKNNKLCVACSTTLNNRAKKEGGRAKCPFCRKPYGKTYNKPKSPESGPSGVMELILWDLPRPIETTSSNITPVEAVMILENNNMVMQHTANRLALQRQFVQMVMASGRHTNSQRR